MLEIIVLRWVHIVGGMFWAGSGAYSAFFLMPALRETGPSMGPVIAALQRRGLFTALPVVAVATIASGGRLMWIMSGGFAGAYFATPRGAAFGVSALAAICAWILATTVGGRMNRLAAVRAAELEAETNENRRTLLLAEVSRLRRLGGVGQRAAVWLLLLSASGMAVARYLG